MFIVAVTSTFNKDFTIKKETSSIVFSWVMFAFSLSIIPILIITRVNNVVKQETPERIASTEKIEVTKKIFTSQLFCSIFVIRSLLTILQKNFLLSLKKSKNTKSTERSIRV